jgi:hypothetical protein
MTQRFYRILDGPTPTLRDFLSHRAGASFRGVG